jgi:hypothetical protein
VDANSFRQKPCLASIPATHQSAGVEGELGTVAGHRESRSAGRHYVIQVAQSVLQCIQ